MKSWETLYEVKGPKTLVEMSSTELKEALKHTDTIILSFAAIEDHASHLPLGADYYQGDILVKMVYETLLEMGIKTVPGFTVPFGVETNKFERKHIFGNCAISQSTFIALVKDLVISLNSHGFKKFVFILGHAENSGALHVAAKDLGDMLGIQCLVLDWIVAINDKFWKTVLKNQKHQGHGGEDETACVMAAVPKLVNTQGVEPWYPEEKHQKEVNDSGLHYYGGAVGIYTPIEEDKSPAGYVGDPASATAEEGILCYEAYAKWIADAVQKYFFGGETK